VQALTGYLGIRASRAAPAGPLLAGETGHRLNLTMARHIFRSLTRQCRLAPHPGCGAPRLHDFRHRFAVNTLIDAHRQGRDVDACIAVLATHLGHVSPVHTYWYLTITPELVDAVSERVALYYQQGRRR
jgi:integrase